MPPRLPARGRRWPIEIKAVAVVGNFGVDIVVGVLLPRFGVHDPWKRDNARVWLGVVAAVYWLAAYQVITWYLRRAAASRPWRRDLKPWRAPRPGTGPDAAPDGEQAQPKKPRPRAAQPFRRVHYRKKHHSGGEPR
jgi:hypothetical protein